MKNIARKTKNIIKKTFVVVMALLILGLLLAAIITLSKVISKIFVVCLVVYWTFIFLETVILPLLRRK